MSRVIEEKIFTCTVDEAKRLVTVNFDTQDNNVSKRVQEDKDYAPFLQLKEMVKEMEVFIDGKAPNEAYAALGFYLVRFNAKSITYTNKTGTHPTVCLYVRENKVSERKEWFRFTPGNGLDLAELLPGPSAKGYWPDDVLAQLTTAALIEGKQSPILIITGKGCQEQYAALGIAAALQGYDEIRVEKPKIGYAMAFCEAYAGKMELRAIGQRHGIAVGVVGDPNSGKSVFSKYFFLSVKKCYPDGVDAWVYDCDMASPTPNWYLDGTESEDETVRQQVTKLRNEYKGKWDEEKEAKVTQDLATMKTTMDLLFADMPGGKHPKEGESFAPERIQQGNHAMMEQCEYFIILCRKDKPHVFEAWREALREHGLADRVLAKIITDAPTADVRVSKLSKDEQGIFTCEIQGLHRSKPGDQIVDAMNNSLRLLVYFLVQSALQRR
ncbi:MAG: hypothetical protein IJS08_05420 [Victivallales bacterium]|nr:hypothetical protein [Victivallales bacterium]